MSDIHDQRPNLTNTTEDLRVHQQPTPSATVGTDTNVASATSSTTILAANTNRKSAIIYNDSTAILYLDLSGGTASTTHYSVQVAAQGNFVTKDGMTELITGVWASANGFARVTELV